MIETRRIALLVFGFAKPPTREADVLLLQSHRVIGSCAYLEKLRSPDSLHASNNNL